MNQGIVVGTWSGGQKEANLCLNSLKPLYGKYPILVAINNFNEADPEWVESLSKYFPILEIYEDFRELGAIITATAHTNLDEFWFIQDTVEILDTSFIEMTFKVFPGVTCSYHRNPMQYYLGKWRTSIIKQTPLFSFPKTKEEAIYLEWTYTNAYLETAKEPKGHLVVDLEFNLENWNANFLQKTFGEDRIGIVGRHLIKRLSIADWNPEKKDDVLAGLKRLPPLE